MADDCEQHRGTETETSPHLDQILEELPENQSGAGRHKCAYCAYEAGLRAGLEDALGKRICDAFIPFGIFMKTKK